MKRKTTNKNGIDLFVRECVKNGMTKIVCSPGSRNAPLIIAFDEHPEVETLLIHDERSAAFFALGMAIETKEPVGVLCTSGSAMLNYYPAVAEAYYQEVPLVVISADRPQEWINHGDGQTIVQKNVYQNHIRVELEIKEFLDENEYDVEAEKIRSAFLKGIKNWIGPIHFNVPLTEPIYDVVEVDSKQEEKYEELPLSFCLSEEEKSEIQKIWKSSEKKMVLVGQMPKNKSFDYYLDSLANDASVIVLTENTANLTSKKFIYCIDRTLEGIDKEKVEDFTPDLLITFGGAVISKRIKKFLREADIKNHWRISTSFPEMDTYRHLSRFYNANPQDFLKEILPLIGENGVSKSNFRGKWKQVDYLVKDKVESNLIKFPYSDLKVMQLILDTIPEGINLHLSNSSIVRYAQLFDPVPSIHYYCNRGTSGIDGSTSTASGVSFVSKNKMNVLITGDISFLYDSNALWNENLESNFKIILINNGGGGIFKFIPGPDSTNQFNKFFVAEHHCTAKHLCEAFHIDYCYVDDMEQLVFAIDELLSSDTISLLEISTREVDNEMVLREYFRMISEQ